PTGAITFGPKDDMVTYGEQRAADLKERGFKSAGLYNPAGVGGTHVMYVLKHADQPALTGLPANPSISPWVSMWKGLSKPVGLAVMAGAALAGWFHYLRKGPLEVSDEDEALAAADAANPTQGEPR
ncbi:MAG: formate dehydrogenase N subunit beta transmembrane domain-containing protein, partial [Ottowia sp.]